MLFFFLDLLVYFFLLFFSHSFFSFSSPLITYVSHSFFSQEKATAEANKATAEKDKAACESEAATEQISRDTVLNACITSFGSSKSVYENHVQELADVAAMRKVLDEHLAPLIPGDTGAGGESNNGAGGESNNGAGGESNNGVSATEIAAQREKDLAAAADKAAAEKYDLYEGRGCKGRNEISAGALSQHDQSTKTREDCMAKCDSTANCVSFEAYSDGKGGIGGCQFSTTCRNNLAANYGHIKLYVKK